MHNKYLYTKGNIDAKNSDLVHYFQMIIIIFIVDLNKIQ